MQSIIEIGGDGKIGLLPLSKGGIRLQENTIYFKGRGYDRIILTKVGPEYVEYITARNPKPIQLERPLAEYLLKQGCELWLKTGYPQYHPVLANGVRNLLAGRPAPKVNPEDLIYRNWVCKGPAKVEGYTDLYALVKNSAVVGGYYEKDGIQEFEFEADNETVEQFRKKLLDVTFTLKKEKN